MKTYYGVFCSDQVSRTGICIPAKELMVGYEKHIIDKHIAKKPMGSPSHIQHDMHRPFGWTNIVGLFIDGAMVRVIGKIQECDTEEERTSLASLCDEYWSHQHGIGMESFKAQLLERIGLTEAPDASSFVRIESFCISYPNVAAQLYPDLFDPKKGLVDKDGLVDYTILNKRMKQLQPGVYHDTALDLVIFAHRFFRRSLSHRNKLNDYFLSTWDEVVEELGDAVIPRIRLDPDLLGHPDTVLGLVELEYWHGPKYDDNIESIHSGVSEHKADERTRFFEGVDKTHIWWKDPETRLDGDTSSKYRTFEVEELIENPSAGLDDSYGCRYAHAEYSLASSSISHFDGAIRAYISDSYLERIDKQISHAGKHAQYDKLFRLDGYIPIDKWKLLLTNYFKGNPLIPEYLGQCEEVDASTDLAESITESYSELCAFVSFEPGSLPEGFLIIISQLSQNTYALEVGFGAVEIFFRNKIDLTGVPSCAPSKHKNFNYPNLLFGPTLDLPGKMNEVIEGLLTALQEDIQNSIVDGIAIPLSWQCGDYVITLSLRGEAQMVEQVLGQLLSIVDPSELPSTWLEELSALIKNLSPQSTPLENLTGVQDGILSYGLSDEILVKILMSEDEYHRSFGVIV